MSILGRICFGHLCPFEKRPQMDTKENGGTKCLKYYLWEHQILQEIV
mgnify:CR=1 FL=1